MSSDLRFEWDPRKAIANAKKHGVTFEEASTVFSDENGLFMADPEHSDSEDRFLLLGISRALKLLVVVIASAQATTLCGSSTLERPIARSAANTTNG